MALTSTSENNFRLRYRIGKQRFVKTFHGTLADAKKELRALLRSGDTGEHVAPRQGESWRDGPSNGLQSAVPVVTARCRQ